MRRLARLAAPFLSPFAGRRWFRLWAVLEHRGRTSGTPYATTVVARRVPGGFVIPLPFGDATQWSRNVLAAGGCSMRWNGWTFAVSQPRVIGRDEGAAAFSTFQRWALWRSGIQSFLQVQADART